MKTLTACLVLLLSLTAYAQQPGIGPAGPAPNQMQPDLSGERLRQLIRAADEMDRAGQPSQAAGLRQQAEQERQVLLRQVVNLRAEIERIEQIVGNRQQVIINLKVMEVSLTKLEAMGIDVAKLLGSAATAPDDPKKVAAPGTLVVIDNPNDTGRLLETLQKDGQGRILAEPQLVTLNGQEAVFRSGGQVAIPKPQKDGFSAVDYQFYGTEVQLKPEVLVDNSVRLSIRCGVSELDYANSTHVGKDVIPGIHTRNVATTAKIPNGRTLVLAGFVQSRIDTEMSGLPVVSDLPYVGAPFRKVKEHRTKTATFVLITPELVQPLYENAKPAGAAAATQPMPTDPNIRR
jgi:pilus assembly protein CpaC